MESDNRTHLAYDDTPSRSDGSLLSKSGCRRSSGLRRQARRGRGADRVAVEGAQRSVNMSERGDSISEIVIGSLHVRMCLSWWVHGCMPNRALEAHHCALLCE
jgi:hypothetical protein